MNALESHLLQQLSPWRQASGWCVGLSGGLDSTVLLHAVARLARLHQLPPIRVIHVQHNLQAIAQQWPEHCQRLCDALELPLDVVEVEVAVEASVERAARNARYAAFAQCLQPGEVLLVGQHQDDQAETVLFRLLRGAGVRGLAAMPLDRCLGAGVLVRPLLQCSRSELERYAAQQHLQWVEDPSNADTRLARNYLRHQVLPIITDYWPQAGQNLARAAQNLREAEQLLGELAQLDLAKAQSPSAWPWLTMPSLDLAPLRELNSNRQRNALRHWLQPFTEMPDRQHWAGWQSLLEAPEDSAPIWRLAAGQVVRAQDRIWWLSGDWLRPVVPVELNVQGALQSLPNNGQVCVQGVPPVGGLRVTYRQGGEVMHVPGRGRRDLKRLLNEAGVPAFVRGRLPLLWRADELLAVANVPGLDGPASGQWRFTWSTVNGAQGLS